MRVGDIIRLEKNVKRISDPIGYIENLAVGKAVLNVGAAGGVEGYLPHNRHGWLHHRLQSVAKKVVGIDIDPHGITNARAHGVEIVEANAENADLGQKFDLCVLSDVIEHMGAPANALKNLMHHLSQGRVLCITTPNALSGLCVLKALLGKSPHVYWDHISAYCPEHLQGLCDRYQYRLEEVLFFDYIDKRTWPLRLKSYVCSGFSTVFPRLSSSFLGIVRHA